MTERYLGWLQDERSRTVLESLGAADLDETQQAILEIAVKYYSSGHRYNGAVNALAPSVGSKANASALISNMSIVLEGERRGGLRKLEQRK